MFISDNDKKTYKSIILLNELINGKHTYNTINNGDDALLEKLFIDLMAKGYVSTSGSRYVATDKGKEVLNTFMKRYTEYLKVYDVFSFVDIDKAEFAFSKFYDFDTDDAWDKFKSNSRFEDLRIAVAMFKKLNPAEIVFMSFINENRFDTSVTGWQIDLLSDAIWDEIEEICKTAIKPEQLSSKPGQWHEMIDMIEQGSKIMVELIKEEEKRHKEEMESMKNSVSNDGDDYEEVVEEYYEPISYYESYYDPYFISPIWMLPLFLW